MIYSKVYFFGTCVGDVVFSNACLAAIRLLKKAGVEEIIFPKQQSCCGQPAFNSGYTDEALAVAKKQIEAFSKYPYPIVVPSGSCAGMMQKHYKALFAGTDMEERAEEFSSRVYEFTTFLVTECGVSYEDKGSPIRITWHSSCHAMREAGCIEHAKSLLRQLKNVELIELEKEYECCGFGGTFSVKMPELSVAMATEKVEDIVKTQAQRVISTDGACLMNIGTTMEKRGIPIATQHIAEFLWERVYE